MSKAPAVRMKVLRKSNEDKIQASIVSTYRKLFSCIIAAVPNGGNRNKNEAAKLKWTGTLAGIPDLFVLSEDVPTFLMECKDPSEIQARERDLLPQERFWSLSDSQKEIVPLIRAMGFTVYVVCSLDEALAAAEHAGLGPRRAPIRTSIEARTGF
jgi:hypothetical protein